MSGLYCKHDKYYTVGGLIAEYPNKFVCKRWQTQRFIIRYIINVKRWHTNPTFCSLYIIYGYASIGVHGRTLSAFY